MGVPAKRRKRLLRRTGIEREQLGLPPSPYHAVYAETAKIGSLRVGMMWTPSSRWRMLGVCPMKRLPDMAQFPISHHCSPSQARTGRTCPRAINNAPPLQAPFAPWGCRSATSGRARVGPRRIFPRAGLAGASAMLRYHPQPIPGYLTAAALCGTHTRPDILRGRINTIVVSNIL